MANGTVDEKVARSDRLAEQRDRARIAAEQRKRGIANAINNVREGGSALPGSEPYREEMDSVTEATFGPKGFHGKNIPRWAMGIIGVAIALAILAVGLAAVVRLVR